MTRNNLFPSLSSSSRGQAALEFISTYGFAFLMLLVTLSVLSYFGVFNTSSFRSSSCSFPQGISCTDYVLDRADPGVPPGFGPYVRMNLTNSYGVNITLTAAQLSLRESETLTACAPLPTNWGDGTSFILWCEFPSALFLPGTFYQGTVVVNFTQIGGGYSHSVTGRFATSAQ